jgi:hypothetical protein
MKTNYFTKVENKFVFNVSLIFWHLFIALSILGIALSFLVFLWSIIPPSKRTVVKKPYPEKQRYPEPVKVSLNDLKLEETKPEEILKEPEQVPPAAAQPEQPTYEDTKGKTEYETSLNLLKELIPSAKYPWTGSGFWTYPYGERYWTVYQQAKYHQWNITEPGVEDKLNSSYKTAKAKNYPDKKQVLDGFISVVKPLPEDKRLSALQYLMGNVANEITQSVNVSQAIARVVGKMPGEDNISYINLLAVFGKKNPKDGARLIDYVSTVIDKFDALQRVKIIDGLTSYYSIYFSQNFPKQKEATDLFVPMLAQIRGEYHPKALKQYYELYLGKNYERDNVIAQIENEYQQKVGEIDSQYVSENAQATAAYAKKIAIKVASLGFSLMGIGASILLIVLIASILVFFSIQRSVRRIEEKISAT